MASYHLTVKPIGRSEGRSIVAASAYRAGVKMLCDETGLVHNFENKGAVVSNDLLVPDHAPEWARDASTLWNAVELRESRQNSRLAREIEISIPHELSREQAREMVIDWARENIVSKGMCAEISLHDPDNGTSGVRNFHGHILTTVREFDGDGWMKDKNRDWNGKDQLRIWRETWAKAQNVALEVSGSVERVDHRSLEAQREAAIQSGDHDLAEALDRPPELRMGLKVSMAEKNARRRAERDGYKYEPVTNVARHVAHSRMLRGRISSALSVLRSSAAEIKEVMSGFVTSIASSGRLASVEMPGLDVKPDPEPDDGPSI